MAVQKIGGGYQDNKYTWSMAIAWNLAIALVRYSLSPDILARILPIIFPPVTSDAPGELFCGDTIFAGGCGRLFEGTPAQMVGSMTKLRQLPDNTRIWCAHEYTLSNLKFAVTVDPTNQELQQRLVDVTAARQQLIPTVPTSLGIEKRTNPFLRWDTAPLHASVASSDPIETFARIRGRKDQF